MAVMANVFVKWAGGIFPAPFLYNAIVAKMVGEKAKMVPDPTFRRIPAEGCRLYICQVISCIVHRGREIASYLTMFPSFRIWQKKRSLAGDRKS